MITISHELKLMLLDQSKLEIIEHVEEIDFHFNGKSCKVPAKSWQEIKLDLKDQPELFSECEKWYETLMTYFKTSYKAGKIDIGFFEGLWPVDFNHETMVVNFLADTIRPNRKHWKDWFEEGAQYAS